MLTIELPLTRATWAAAVGLSLLGSGLVLLSRATLPWRLIWVVLLLTVAALGVQRFRRRRPVSLLVRPDGQLDCVLRDGRRVAITQCELGVVRPWLVSARLTAHGTGRLDLFVPGVVLSQTAHWELRRALIGFRPGAGSEQA